MLLPSAAKAYRALGASLDRAGEDDAALRAFKRAMQLEPAESNSYIGAAAVLKRLGNLKGALKVLKSCPPLASPADQAVVYLETAAVLLDRAEDASGSCRKLHTGTVLRTQTRPVARVALPSPVGHARAAKRCRYSAMSALCAWIT